jgi:hypothetical protein
MHAKKTLAIAFAVVMTFTAMGCGGSKKSDNVSAADAGKSEKQSDGSVATTTTYDYSGSSDTSGSSTSDGSSVLGLGASSDCLAASVAYAGLFVEAAGFAGGAQQSEIDDFEAKTQDLKAKIPASEQDDFQTVATAYHQYAEAVKGIDFTDLLNPATQDKLKQAGAALDDPSVKAAQDRIDAYFKTTCGG